MLSRRGLLFGFAATASSPVGTLASVKVTGQPPICSPEVIEAHAGRASCIDLIWNGAGGIHRAVQVGLRRRAARVYAERYFEHFGCLPEGEHVVEVSYGPTSSEAQIKTSFPGLAGTLREALTYPLLSESDLPDHAIDETPIIDKYGRRLSRLRLT